MSDVIVASCLSSGNRRRFQSVFVIHHLSDRKLVDQLINAIRERGHEMTPQRKEKSMDLSAATCKSSAAATGTVYDDQHCCHDDWLVSSVSRLMKTYKDMTLQQAIYTGAALSTTLVLVVSDDFLYRPEVYDIDTNGSSVWNIVSDSGLLCRPRRDVVAVVVNRLCNVPPNLSDRVDHVLDFSDANWSKEFVDLIFPIKTPANGSSMSEITSSSSCSSLDTEKRPHNRNGCLLVSIKSRGRCRKFYCRESVDALSVLPNEFLAHGIEIRADVYSDVIQQLVDGSRSTYHFCCFSVPIAMVTFAALLCLCIIAVPAIERQFLMTSYSRPENSAPSSISTSALVRAPPPPSPAEQITTESVSAQINRSVFGNAIETVHGIVVWLCFLTAYLIGMHISRYALLADIDERLAGVNQVLSKYNLLVGVENLGFLDCNKFYLHVFYYEMGHCLAYLQESLSLASTSSDDLYLAEPEQEVRRVSDRRHVLDKPHFLTNNSLQLKTERLLLAYSGHYAGLLASRKLSRPRCSRHVADAMCLCQYVEMKSSLLALTKPTSSSTCATIGCRSGCEGSRPYVINV